MIQQHVKRKWVQEVQKHNYTHERASLSVYMFVGYMRNSRARMRCVCAREHIEIVAVAMLYAHRMHGTRLQTVLLFEN